MSDQVLSRKVCYLVRVPDFNIITAVITVAISAESESKDCQFNLLNLDMAEAEPRFFGIDDVEM